MIFSNNSRCSLVLPVLLTVQLLNSCTQPFAQGKELYTANCSRCHGVDGRGFENLYPDLMHSSYLGNDGTNLACVIAYGSRYLNSQRESTHTVIMPENQHLSAVEILNIINYLSWEFGKGNQQKIDVVMQSLDGCKE